MTKLFCSKCGQDLTYNTKRYIVIGEDTFYSPSRKQSVTINTYGTYCCKAKIFSDLDIHWDYDDRLPDGEKIEHKDLATIVKLCCAINKSPSSIRKSLTGYYFQVKSNKHLNNLHTVFQDQIRAENANI